MCTLVSHSLLLPPPHLEYEISVLLGLQERVPVRDGVADDEALAAAHVLLAHSGELDLAGGVKNVWKKK